jgi:tungstate transport system permease protein
VDLLIESFTEAWRLLRTGDDAVYEITLRTVLVSGTSALLAALIGLPLGVRIASGRYRGQRVLVAMAYASIGLPPVIAGLIVSMMLWRSGPLGDLGLIYTPAAMVMAQVLISTPIVVAVTVAAVMALPPALHLQIRAMGAGAAQYFALVSREARLPLLVAMMAGFGSAVSEVAAAQMTGGNIAGETRVLTTAAVWYVGRGEFGTALALGFILLAIVAVIALLFTGVQYRMRRT